MAALSSAALVFLSVLGGSAEAGASASRPPAEFTSSQSPEALAIYRRQLDAYAQARQTFEAAATTYWEAVAQKRRQRNAKRRDHQGVSLDDYVLIQPPVYTGPPPPEPPPSEPPPQRSEDAPQPAARPSIPVVADFLESARAYFGFAPRLPRDDLAFKRAYAKAALAAGLTPQQIVRIYAFETGGNGTYDMQAGREYSRVARAVSPALGYNQLLNTNSVELLAEHGDRFVGTLTARAAALTGDARTQLERKIAVLRRAIAFCRTVPDDWTAHDRLANTPQGLGVHAFVLDIDIGPLLQVQKLLDSVEFARRRGYRAPLAAAELEMLNLTGDGNGLDMVMMPAALREQVPTANFFQRAGYERNPVAIRNNTVAKLIAATNAAMDQFAALPGGREFAEAVAAAR